MSLAENIRKDVSAIEKYIDDVNVFLISFRIINDDQKNYHKIYSDLLNQINIIDSSPYHHTTSTYIVKSKVDISTFSSFLKKCIRSTDHLIVIKLPSDISSCFLGPLADFSTLQTYVPSILHV